MNAMVKYAALFFGALVVAAEVVLLLVPQHTEEGTVKVAASVTTGGKDSVMARTGGSNAVDNASLTGQQDTSQHAPPAASVMHDSVAFLRKQLESERQKVTALGSRMVQDTTRHGAPESNEIKTMAKLIDAMDALGAAKILRNLDDKEVKEILLSVKKRQAGKILGSLDPERAARIMKWEQ